VVDKVSNRLNIKKRAIVYLLLDLLIQGPQHLVVQHLREIPLEYRSAS
jgi:hypothetical protein